MSRAMFIALDEASVLARCEAEQVGVSSLELLPQGGVRLVCMSMDGADRMRGKLKAQLIQGEVVRERRRPRTPLW